MSVEVLPANEAFIIHVERETLSLSKSGTVTGNTFLQIGDFFFPGQGWNDFPVIILSSWLEVIAQTEHSRYSDYTCHFMGGPFEFRINTKNDPQWLVQFFKRRVQGKNLLFQTPMDRESVKEAVLAATKIVIDVCTNNRWDSKGIDSLNTSLKTLLQQP